MWKLCDGQQLRHRQWDAECVLYNDLSGDTHLLQADTMIVLLALRAGPADHRALAQRLDATEHDMAQLLAALALLALIEPAC